MQLSPHFKLSEFTYSDTARSMGNANTPEPKHLENLKTLACQMELVRLVLGNKPINITSGYRNPAVNRAVGGVPNSDHANGLAVDFHCYGFGSDYDVANAIANSDLQFDQLIYEVSLHGGTWVHLGFGPRMRRDIFTEKKVRTGKVNLPGIVK